MLDLVMAWATPIIGTENKQHPLLDLYLQLWFFFFIFCFALIPEGFFFCLFVWICFAVIRFESACTGWGSHTHTHYSTNIRVFDCSGNQHSPFCCQTGSRFLYLSIGHRISSFRHSFLNFVFKLLLLLISSHSPSNSSYAALDETIHNP